MSEYLKEDVQISLRAQGLIKRVISIDSATLNESSKRVLRG